MTRNRGFLVIAVFIMLFVLIVNAEEQIAQNHTYDSSNSNASNDVAGINETLNGILSLNYSNGTINEEPNIDSNQTQNTALVENNQAIGANEPMTSNDISNPATTDSSNISGNGRKAVGASFGVYLNIVG